MKLSLKILLCLFIALILFSGGATLYLTRGLEAENEVLINEIDLSSLDDGVYNGKYDVGRWANEVNVTIKDHKIVNINMVKDVTFVKPEVTRELLNIVIEQQTTNVDTISGATVTCKAYLKSIENALINK